MATDKQIAANRRNAQKSTGPKSPEGKQKVAQNRTKHGFTSREHALIPGEDEAAYESLRATLMREWEPESEAEAFQVELMAMHQWRILRAARYERQAFLRRMKTWGPNASFPDDAETLSRYEARSTRSYFKAMEVLRRLQSERVVMPAHRDQAQDPAAASTPPPTATELNHLPGDESSRHSKPIPTPPPPPRPHPTPEEGPTVDLP